MKIQTKLILVAAVFSILIMSLGLFGLWKSRDAAQTSLTIDRLHALSSIHKDLGLVSYTALTEGDKQALEDAALMIKEYHELYSFGFDQMWNYTSIEDHEIAKALRPRFDDLYRISREIVARRAADPNPQMDEEFEPMRAELMDTIEELDIDTELLADEIRHKLVSINNETLLSKFFMAIFLLFTILLVVAVNIIFSRLVYRPITQLHRAVSEMESGKLDVSVVIDRDDEFGQLGRAFNNMAQALQKNTEELRHAMVAAEAATEAKSRFVGTMSHELRTPLNAVIGYSELLAEELEERGHEDLLTDANRINVAGKALLNLISHVLDLEKIEVNKLDLNPESVDLPQMLGELEVTILPLAQKNNNHFLMHNTCHVDRIFSDGQKLRQILTNLLSNAVKFTDNGCVTLAVSEEQKDDTHWICFEVADSGIGMTPSQVDKVFDAFVQADSSTTRNYGGTGLGLTISREFARLMGGDITVRSCPGEGSVFSLRIPSTSLPRLQESDTAPSNQPAEV